MQTGFTNEVALVTGASRGLGQAIAVGLAQHGASVMCVARGEAGLEETVRQAAAGGSHAAWIATDLTADSAPGYVVQHTIDTFGRIDILVNNAGRPYPTSGVGDIAAAWDYVLALNLRAAYLLCESAGQHLKEQRSGKVVNITSILSAVADRDARCAYIAAKHGLLGVTRALAVHWAEFGIQVNAVAPGYIKTEMTLPETQDASISRSIIGRTPSGRWGEPDDVVGAVIYLASRASDFVTGQTLFVDGGWTAQ